MTVQAAGRRQLILVALEGGLTFGRGAGSRSMSSSGRTETDDHRYGCGALPGADAADRLRRTLEGLLQRKPDHGASNHPYVAFAIDALGNVFYAFGGEVWGSAFLAAVALGSWLALRPGLFSVALPVLAVALVATLARRRLHRAPRRPRP